MENVKKHRDIRLVETTRKRSRLVAELNYHTTKYILKILLAVKMNQKELKVNKPAHLGLLVLYMSKIAIYKYCYDYTKSMYKDKVNLYATRMLTVS